MTRDHLIKMLSMLYLDMTGQVNTEIQLTIAIVFDIIFDFGFFTCGDAFSVFSLVFNLKLLQFSQASDQNNYICQKDKRVSPEAGG